MMMEDEPFQLTRSKRRAELLEEQRLLTTVVENAGGEKTLRPPATDGFTGVPTPPLVVTPRGGNVRLF